MQMILCSRCWENVAQFAFPKFHLVFVVIWSVGCVAKHGSKWAYVGCAESHPVHVPIFVEDGHCATWPSTRLVNIHGPSVQSERNVFVSSQLPDLGSVGTIIPSTSHRYCPLVRNPRLRGGYWSRPHRWLGVDEPAGQHWSSRWQVAYRRWWLCSYPHGWCQTV